MKMNTSQTQQLIAEYYKYVRMGTPFLSCFPEEWVLRAIMGQPEFNSWSAQPFYYLVDGSRTNVEDTPELYDQARRTGLYFYLRTGR